MEWLDPDLLLDEPPVNPGANRTFQSILATRLDRPPTSSCAGVSRSGPPPPRSRSTCPGLRHPDGRRDPIESIVAPPAAPADGRVLSEEAQRHHEQALTPGAGAAAHVGLVALALESGGTEEASRRFAATGALDSSLPPALLSAIAIPAARP
jgi:hypothetical protein